MISLNFMPVLRAFAYKAWHMYSYGRARSEISVRIVVRL
jgi:hypothetical protein